MVDYLEKPLNSQSLRRMISQVDLLCVNSRVLYRRYHHLNPHTVVVPQGFRLDSFRRFRRATSRRTFGYVGGVNFRLDYPLLITLARRHPEWHFTFCGPIFDYRSVQEKQITTLLALPNVTHIPSVPKARIPAIIGQFKVGLIPYDLKLVFNKNSHPMKIFEYFYAGLPVVSTPITELAQYQPLVKLGRTVSDWEQLLTQLSRQSWPKTYQRQQRALAEANSWWHKINAIYQAINKVKASTSKQ